MVWFIDSLLYCSLYIYRSSLLLKEVSKTKGNLIVFAFKSEKERQLARVRERFQEKKHKTDTKIEANKIKSENFVGSNKEKFNLAEYQ